MNITELRRLLITTGLSLDGLVTRDALVERLCKHFGVKMEELQNESPASAAFGQEKSEQTLEATRIDIDEEIKTNQVRNKNRATPAEAAMNAKLHFPDKDPLEAFKKPVPPSSVQSDISMLNSSSSIPAPPTKMDSELLKKVVSIDPFGGSFERGPGMGLESRLEGPTLPSRGAAGASNGSKSNLVTSSRGNFIVDQRSSGCRFCK
jgi:hypothetical protein